MTGVEQSSTVGELAKALALAQSKIDHASKDRANPFFRSRYATLPSVIDATRVLAEHGIAVVQACGYDPQTETANCRTTLLHESGEWIAGTLSAPAFPPRGKNDPPDKPLDITAQSVGSALTYVRRYSLMGMVCISSDEDDDGNSATHRQRTEQHAAPAAKPASRPTPKPAAKPEQDWRTAGLAALAALGVTEAQVVERVGSNYTRDDLKRMWKEADAAAKAAKAAPDHDPEWGV